MGQLNRITTEQLSTFLRITQTGSFSRAAFALDVAQPTISARVKALEDAVGGPLFARRGRSVALTARGEAFQAYAERAVAVLEEGLLAARLDSDTPVGRVTLGVSDSALADSFLGAAVARFHRDHPKIEVLAEMSSCNHLVPALYDKVLRLALLPWPYANPSFDGLRPLLRFREQLRMVTSANHPLANAGRLTLADVGRMAQPFLRLWWNQPSGRQLDALGGLPQPVLEVPIHVARHTLLQGRGVALFAPSVIAHELEHGTLVTLDVEDLDPVVAESALVVPATAQELSAAAEAFVEALRIAAGDLCIPC